MRMMNKTNLFRQRFKFTNHHDLKKLLNVTKFMKLIFEFMKFVKKKAWSKMKNQQLMKNFCDMIQHSKMWHLIQTIVFEFRIFFHNQWIFRTQNELSRLIWFLRSNISKISKKKQKSCFKFVFQNVSKFLSSFWCDRNDQNNFSSLTSLIRQRHKNFVEFLVLCEKFKNNLTSKEKREIIERVISIEKILFREFNLQANQTSINVFITYKNRRRQKVFKHKFQIKSKILIDANAKL